VAVVAEPGGAGGHRAPLAPLPERMAPLVRLVRRPPLYVWAMLAAGGVAKKNKEGRQKIYVHVFAAPVKYATVAPQENFHAPLGRNPGSATEMVIWRCTVGQSLQTITKTG
jgi:hypothetical protein